MKHSQHWFFFMKKNDLIELGTCNRPFGIKGGFHFFLHSAQESILKDKAEIILMPKDSGSSLDPDGETHIIKSIQIGNKAVCYLENITDRNIVEKMIPFAIFYPRSKFPEAQDGEFYLNDLVGVEVFNQSGKRVGEVHSSYDNGAQTVLRIKTKTEIIDLPFIDNFFPEVDIENNKIVMNQPEMME